MVEWYTPRRSCQGLRFLFRQARLASLRRRGGLYLGRQIALRRYQACLPPITPGETKTSAVGLGLDNFSETVNLHGWENSYTASFRNRTLRESS